MTGKDEPVLAAAGARADLRERGRVGSRDRRLRGDGRRTATIRPRTVELLSQIAEIEERRLSHQNAAFDAYGRALRVDPTNPDVLAHLERLAERDRALGQAGRAATRPRSSKVDEAAPQVETAAAAGAHLRGGDRPARRGDRHLPARDRRRARQQGRRWSRSIACTGAPQQWAELAEVVRREIRLRRHRRGSIIALNFRLAQIYELALVRPAQGGRGLPRDPDRQPDARARRARRSSGCSWAARCSSRSPTCSSRCTGRARSGRSCIGSTRCSSSG